MASFKFNKEYKRVSAIVAILVTVGILQAIAPHGIYNPTKLNSRQLSKNKGKLSPSPFLDQTLNKLVSDWRSSKVSVESAKQAIWDIIQSPLYKNHLPNKGIVFIKTHKTASSTITSLLHSISTSHGLTAAIATHKTTKEAVNNKQDKRRAQFLNLPTSNPDHPWGAPYDVWSNHIVFDEILLDEAVPTSEGKFFSIVRDPGTRLRSACLFFGCCPASTPEDWASFVLNSQKEYYEGPCSLNQSFKEINGNKASDDALLAMKQRVHQGNLLLLVTERIMESVLVLRDFYELHPLDVTFLSQKVRSNPTTAKSRDLIKAEGMMREWNEYDTAIHELADSMLTKKMEDMFPQEVNRIRAVEEMETLNDLIYHVCSREHKKVVPKLNPWCREKEVDTHTWNKMHLGQFSNIYSHE